MIRARVKRTRRPVHIEAAVARGIRWAADRGLEIETKLVSGTVSSAELRQDGHPYGRAPASPNARGRQIGPQRSSLPVLPINMDSRQLVESAFIHPEGDARWSLGFDSAHAIVLIPGGTKNMVARGFWAELVRQMKPVIRSKVRQAIREEFAG